MAALFDDPADGPLPALLLVLTALTGVIDAVSILRLGRVFVANMTGNVVFVGFALAGAPGFALSASLFALGGFVAGAALGGSVARRLGGDRAILLRAGVTVELLFVITALAVSAALGGAPKGAATDALAAVSALAMGVQNAVVRRLRVADLTTTVLTMTLTGIAADRDDGRSRGTVLRRILAVAAMVGGAVAGAELVLHDGVTAGLALASGVLVAATAGSVAGARRSGPLACRLDAAATRGGWRHVGVVTRM